MIRLLIKFRISYQQQKRNTVFLRYDSGSGNDRIIIFSSTEQLQLLENGEELLVDGTFKVSPSIFYQLYAMHVVYRNAVLPVVFALLPNKTEQTYRRLINENYPSFAHRGIQNLS
ncbi:unnamed protein product [Rotaria socialis]|nr:unnamed protein product [Rotaria socialis]